jgi:hypothetical protein
MSDNATTTVRNLTNHTVSYTIPEKGFVRRFEAYQEREVEKDELRLLYAARGGRELLTQYLSVEDMDLAVEEFNIPTDVYENEYNWTEAQVDAVLQSGSVDELKDALEFGPEGIKELIISRAITLRIPDRNKLNAIEDFTGRNVASMIAQTEAMQEQVQEEEKPRTRRAAKTSSEGTTRTRRVPKTATAEVASEESTTN